MRGRMGMSVLLMTAAMLVAGCSTPQQREQKKQMQQEKKMAAAEAKKQKEIAATQAREAKAEAKRQQDEAKRLAAAQARQQELDRKQAEKERKQMAAEEKENKEALGYDMMRDERKVRSLDRFALAQAAQGAREDATLNDAHFDSGELNALGRSKLYLIGRGVPSGTQVPVMVYVNSSEANLSQARLAAVESYWKSSQYADLALHIKAGTNDDLLTPVKVGLDGLKKMDDKKAEGNTRNVNMNVTGGAPPVTGGTP